MATKTESERGLATKTEKEFSKTGGLFALWVGLLAGPVLWLLQFQTNYSLVSLTCRHGGAWVSHAVSIVALVLTTLAGLLARSKWREAGGGWPGEGREGIAPRTRFMSVLGLLISAIFFVVILAQWIAHWVFGPCQW